MVSWPSSMQASAPSSPTAPLEHHALYWRRHNSAASDYFFIYIHNYGNCLRAVLPMYLISAHLYGILAGGHEFTI